MPQLDCPFFIPYVGGTTVGRIEMGTAALRPRGMSSKIPGECAYPRYNLSLTADEWVSYVQYLERMTVILGKHNHPQHMLVSVCEQHDPEKRMLCDH
ncbi:hypothetical protein KBD75_04955 [Candidatus Woesebacteria bacterium]|nr:hypothetical protein [Candidatus Woesebacteria bacterium]